MKVEAVVLGSPPLIVLMVSVDVKQTELGDRSELRSCAKVEVALLVVSVDVKQH